MTRNLFAMLLALISSMQAWSPATAQAEGEYHRIAPEPGVRTTSYPDLIIWTDNRAVMTEGATVATTVRTPGIFGSGLEVRAYDPLTRKRSKTAFKACVGDDGPCLLDDDGDCMFDRIARDDVSGAVNLPSKAPYVRVRVIKYGSDSVRTIRYLGKSGGRTQLQYQETNSNGVITADEIYSLAPYTSATFIRDVTIHIFQADSTKIEFDATSSVQSTKFTTPPCRAITPPAH
jgi:hypothetical protein